MNEIQPEPCKTETIFANNRPTNINLSKQFTLTEFTQYSSCLDLTASILFIHEYVEWKSHFAD